MTLLAANTLLQSILTYSHIGLTIYFALGTILVILYVLQVPNTPTLLAKARVIARSDLATRLMVIPGALLSGITMVLLPAVRGQSIQDRGIVIAIILYLAIMVVAVVFSQRVGKLRQQLSLEARSGKRPSQELMKELKSRLSLVLSLINVVAGTLLIILLASRSLL
jgi:uncharacterized membrane protein